MTKQYLNDWERLAIETALRRSIEDGLTNKDCGLVLLKRLESASRIIVQKKN